MASFAYKNYTQHFWDSHQQNLNTNLSKLLYGVFWLERQEIFTTAFSFKKIPYLKMEEKFLKKIQAIWKLLDIARDKEENIEKKRKKTEKRWKCLFSFSFTKLICCKNLVYNHYSCITVFFAVQVICKAVMK